MKPIGRDKHIFAISKATKRFRSYARTSLSPFPSLYMTVALQSSHGIKNLGCGAVFCGDSPKWQSKRRGSTGGSQMSWGVALFSWMVMENPIWKAPNLKLWVQYCRPGRAQKTWVELQRRINACAVDGPVFSVGSFVTIWVSANIERWDLNCKCIL